MRRIQIRIQGKKSERHGRRESIFYSLYLGKAAGPVQRKSRVVETKSEPVPTKPHCHRDNRLTFIVSQRQLMRILEVKDFLHSFIDFKKEFDIKGCGELYENWTLRRDFHKELNELSTIQ